MTRSAERAKVRVRVTCERCGDVSIGLDRLVLRFCEDDLSSEYRFRCPSCDLVQLQDAGFEAASALLEAEVATEWWSLPTGVGEPSKSWAPITPADVISFALAVQDDDALAAEVSMLGASPNHA
jgi:hypothetical protein